MIGELTNKNKSSLIREGSRKEMEGYGRKYIMIYIRKKRGQSGRKDLRKGGMQK